MECSQGAWLSNEDYLHQFQAKVFERRIPLSGSMDLTHRCNLRCAHCYLGPQPASSDVKKKELSTSRIRSVLDEVTEAGCLNMLFTGGEPLLRKDFHEIYRHAKRNGLMVTVFSNGTLIDDRVIDLLKEYPPLFVDVSLYGSSEATYEKITGVQGSFEKCIRGLELLKEHDIPFKLKTVLMTHNRHEFSSIEDLARQFEVGFRFDAAIFPRLTEDEAPLRLRVSPEEAVDKEFADERRSREWRDFASRAGKIPASDSLYPCGAGVSHFHVDPYGNLQPCLMVTGNRYDLSKGSFAKGWLESTGAIKRIKLDPAHECHGCSDQPFCGYCPGFFELETGAQDSKSEFLCEMGRHRHQKINGSEPCQR